MERKNDQSSLKFISVLFSLVIAIVSWIYVVYNYDPMTKVTYSDVPITFVGEDFLADKGFAVASASVDTITVVLNQRRVDSTKIDADNITVSADVSDAVEGKNGISLDIIGPEGTQVVESDVKAISVDVEKTERVEVDIEVDYMDETDVNSEPIAYNLTSTKATVIGAASAISRVDKAVARIGYSDTAEGVGVYTRSLSAVNDVGDVIPHMVIYPGSVNFSAENGTLKPVLLKLNVADNSNDNYDRTVTAPQMITIKGPSDVVEGIESVYSKEVDVTYIYEDADVDLEYELPEGVYIANDYAGTKAHVQVTEKKTDKKTQKQSDDD